MRMIMMNLIICAIIMKRKQSDYDDNDIYENDVDDYHWRPHVRRYHKKSTGEVFRPWLDNAEEEKCHISMNLNSNFYIYSLVGNAEVGRKLIISKRYLVEVTCWVLLAKSQARCRVLGKNWMALLKLKTNFISHLSKDCISAFLQILPWQRV